MNPATRVQQALKPIENLLIEAHESALNRWARMTATHPRGELAFTPGSKSHALNSLITDEIREALHDIPGIVTDTSSGFLVVLVGNQVVLRFNKLDGDGRPSMNATGARNLWQVHDYPLFESPTNYSPIYATIGYRLDVMGDLVAVQASVMEGDHVVGLVTLERRTSDMSKLAQPAATTQSKAKIVKKKTARREKPA